MRSAVAAAKAAMTRLTSLTRRSLPKIDFRREPNAAQVSMDAKEKASIAVVTTVADTSRGETGATYIETAATAIIQAFGFTS